MPYLLLFPPPIFTLTAVLLPDGSYLAGLLRCLGQFHQNDHQISHWPSTFSDHSRGSYFICSVCLQCSSWILILSNSLHWIPKESGLLKAKHITILIPFVSTTVLVLLLQFFFFIWAWMWKFSALLAFCKKNPFCVINSISSTTTQKVRVSKIFFLINYYNFF